MLVTFYSYKGGVGRSMAMANVAEIFADKGYRVIVCDWDLEAPGLERYLTDDPDELRQLRDQIGIVDLLNEYKATLTQAGTHSLSEDDEDVKKVGDLVLRRPSSVAQNVSSSKRRRGVLRFLSAGRRSGSHEQRYAESVQNFAWSEFYDKWAGGSYLEFFRQDLSGWADIVLIDSRTGVTEHGGVCTHHLADIVVLVSAANDLNLTGTRWMAEILADENLVIQRGGRQLAVLPVASRIEQTAERDELAIFRKRLLVELGRYVPPSLGDQKKYFLETEIPYMPYYSFAERVAARESESLRDPKLYQAYLNLGNGLLKIAFENRLLEAEGDAPKADERAANSAELIKLHKAWLKSGQEEGRRADFSNQDLSRVDFTGEVLRKAIFDGANLRGAVLADADLTDASLVEADLSQVNLRGAKLVGANLDNATLLGANVQEADLRRASMNGANLEAANLRNSKFNWSDLNEADLSNAELDKASFAGANLRGANLRHAHGLHMHQFRSADLTSATLPQPEAPLEQIRDTKDALGASRLWLAIVVGSSIIFAILAGATQDITYVRSSAIFWLYAAATFLPQIALLHLIRSRQQAIFELPAKLPDGRSAVKAAARFIATRVVCVDKEKMVSRMSVSWIWFVAPAMVLALWLRFHHFRGLIGVMILAYMFAVAVFYCLSVYSMQHVEESGPSVRQTTVMRRYYARPFAIGLTIFAVLMLVSIYSIKVWQGGTIVTGRALGIGHPYLDLTGADLREIDISGLDLRFAQLSRANLTGKDLSGSDLFRTYLAFAILVESNMTEATLIEAYLPEADLTNARLVGADLTGAWATNTTMLGADLKNANLSGARVDGASLAGAVLTDAKLSDIRYDAKTVWPKGFSPPAEPLN